jgi:TetR/AcrR family transcriptional repressor of nem operon
MDDSKKFILQTAFKLFMEKSFKAVTFQELKEKTGFSQGACFYLFKNKQQIFEAVIDMYLDHFATVDYSKLPQDSLYEFLNAYFPGANRMRSEYFTPEVAEGENGYALMFEASRIIPDFKEKLARHELKVLAAWTTVIAAAKKNKEIKSRLSDEHIASMFIHIGHGIFLNSTMSKKAKAIQEDVLISWLNIYSLLKK